MEPAKPQKSNIEKIVESISIMYAHIQEQGIEPFLELSQQNPVEAVKQFPDFLKRVLSARNGFFSWMGCGGPDPYATAPLLNVIGNIYPRLTRPVKKAALKRAIDFLDGLNYFNSQNNVGLIQEPWLIRDILINRSLYWCGFKEYTSRLEGVQTWWDFEQEFFREQEEDEAEKALVLKIESFAWLAYSLFRIDAGYDLPEIRQTFAESFPEIVDRTKDFAAALAADHAALEEVDPKKKIPYQTGVKNRLRKHYPADWQEDLERKVGEKKWIWLPERLRELKLESC